MRGETVGDGHEWEHADHRRPGGRWSPVALGLALTVVAVIAVAVTRPGGTGTLAVTEQPSAEPSASAATAPSAVAAEPRAGTTVAPDPLLTASPAVGSEGRPIPDAHFTLITASLRALHVLDAATGATHTVQLPDVLTGDGQPPAMQAVGEQLIVSNDRATVRLDPTDGTATTIAEGVALPGASDDAVWVAGDDAFFGFGGTVTRVDLRGRERDRVRIPAVAHPFAGIGSDLLVTTPTGATLVNGERARAVAIGTQPMAVDGSRLAWTDCDARLRCEIVTGTIDDPDRTRTPLEPDQHPGGFFAPSGAFSPDGSMLAVPLVGVGSDTRPDEATIVVIGTADGREITRIVEGRLAGFGLTTPVWSPEGRWLVFASDAGVSAWDAERDVTAELDMRAPTFAVAVLDP